MKLDGDKCHLLVGGYKHESIWAKFGDARIWESNKQKLLGVHTDRALSFDEHVSNLCKKAGRKLSVLARFSSYMTLSHRRVLRNPSLKPSLATVHQFKCFMVEEYWTEKSIKKENLWNKIMSRIFPPRLINYNLRTQSDFLWNSVSNIKNGLNLIKFFASKFD